METMMETNGNGTVEQAPPEQAEDGSVTVNELLAMIGDLHVRLSLSQRALSQATAEIERLRAAGSTVQG